jgi:hypothetical protein
MLSRTASKSSSTILVVAAKWKKDRSLWSAFGWVVQAEEEEVNGLLGIMAEEVEVVVVTKLRCNEEIIDFVGRVPRLVDDEVQA